MIQILFGLVACFAGFRLFVVLLPILGLFAGFLITAQAIQQLFGGGFLAAVGSWVFAVVVGVVFAVAAYFFYYAAVVILAGSVGYELGVGLIAGLGINSGVLQFIIGLVVAAALIAGVIFLNLPRLFIVALTAIAGASMILTGVLLGLGRVSLTALNLGLVGAFVRSSVFWTLVFLAIVVVGIVVQIIIPDGYTLKPYEQDMVYERSAAHPAPMSTPTRVNPAL